MLKNILKTIKKEERESIKGERNPETKDKLKTKKVEEKFILEENIYFSQINLSHHIVNPEFKRVYYISKYLTENDQNKTLD